MSISESDSDIDFINSLANDSPAEFICPITMEIMKDPVIMPDGQTYERYAIQHALQINPISPMTRQPMRFDQATTNYALKNLIEKYIQSMKEKNKNTHTNHADNVQLTIEMTIIYEKKTNHLKKVISFMCIICFFLLPFLTFVFFYGCSLLLNSKGEKMENALKSFNGKLFEISKTVAIRCYHYLNEKIPVLYKSMKKFFREKFPVFCSVTKSLFVWLYQFIKVKSLVLFSMIKNFCVCSFFFLKEKILFLFSKSRDLIAYIFQFIKKWSPILFSKIKNFCVCSFFFLKEKTLFLFSKSRDLIAYIFQFIKKWSPILFSKLKNFVVFMCQFVGGITKMLFSMTTKLFVSSFQFIRAKIRGLYSKVK